MKPPELEVCYKCGARAPTHPLVLKNENTGENRYYCKKCGDEWLAGGKDWPPEEEAETPVQMH